MSLDAESPAGDVETGEPLVEVTDLKKHYQDGSLLGGSPVKAVDGVSFDINKGETLGLVGESGCGKTTLGRTLLQLETATEGEVLADGTDITTLSGRERREWQRDAQMVFQDPDSSLNDRMTVGEIIREPLDAHGWGTPDERRDRVEELLDRVGLNDEHYYRYPHQFSGGQKQRIGIARALALEPEFIVLDEPVSALDVSVQARIINLLEELQAELGLTYLFIAHDLSVVRHIADRVAVMYLGNIVELGATEAVYTDPQHPYTISLLSAIPGSGSSATWEGERVTLTGTPPNPRDPPAGCPFATRCPAKIRPEDHDLSEAAWTAIEGFRNVLRERSRAESSALDGVKRRLGLGAGELTIEEIHEDLFEAVTLPPDVAETVEAAVDRAETGDDAGAEALLADAFGSVCDTEYPDAYETTGRQSRCLRHQEEYTDPQSVIRERTTED
ncbi:MAG: ABC transporter ATP-binding protein [Halobacteriaceae archaeon]